MRALRRSRRCRPQRAAAPASAAEARGRFFNTGNAFNVINPPVPDRSSRSPRNRVALDPATPTGLIACDISAELGCPFPATSPLVLAHYARIRAGETLATDFVASGTIAYVIAGSGAGLRGGVDRLGAGRRVRPARWPAPPPMPPAPGMRCCGWSRTNPSSPSKICARLLPARRPPAWCTTAAPRSCERQIDLLYDVGRTRAGAGSALIFSAERQEARNVLPTLTAAMNSLPAGVVQRPTGTTRWPCR